MWVERPAGAGTSRLAFWTYEVVDGEQVRDERVVLDFDEDGFALCKKAEGEAARERFPNLTLHQEKPDEDQTPTTPIGDEEEDEEIES